MDSYVKPLQTICSTKATGVNPPPDSHGTNEGSVHDILPAPHRGMCVLQEEN